LKDRQVSRISESRRTLSIT